MFRVRQALDFSSGLFLTPTDHLIRPEHCVAPISEAEIPVRRRRRKRQLSEANAAGPRSTFF